MTNRAVARALWVTRETVKFYLSNVCREPGVGSRVEAAAGVHENGVEGLGAGPAHWIRRPLRSILEPQANYVSS